MPPKQLEKQPEEKNTQADRANSERAENYELGAEIGQLTATERNLPEVNTEASYLKTGIHIKNAEEQLSDDEKNLHQEGKEAESGDTSQEEDWKKPAEGGSTQETPLQREKTEVSWVENRGYFIFLALILVNHF